MIQSKGLLALVFLFFALSLLAQDSTSYELLPVEIRAEKSYTPSKISLSRSHFLSAPASFDDPSRLLMKYPGFSVANDQNNAIIYNGLPSHFSTWSLYGAQITNPNHLSNAGTANDRPSRSAGGVNMFSGQVIGGLEYHTGSDGPAHGIGGVADLSLRSPYQNSVTANLSLIGLEAGIDRVFDDGNSSLIANYRYSTVGLLGQLGVDFGGESIGYQDFITEYQRKWKEHKFRWSLSLGRSNNRLDSIAGFNDAEVELEDIMNIDYTANNIVSAIHYQHHDMEATVAYSRSDVNRNSNYIFNDTLRFTSYQYDESIFSTHAKKKWKTQPINITLQWNASYILSDIDSQTSEDFKRIEIQIQGIRFDKPYWILQPQVQLNRQLGQHTQFTFALQYWISTFRTQLNTDEYLRKSKKWLPTLQIESKSLGINMVLDAGFSTQVHAPELLGIYGADNLTGSGGLYRNSRLFPTKSKYISVDFQKYGMGLKLHHRSLSDLATAVSLASTSLDALNKISISRFGSTGKATISGLSLYGSHTFGNTQLSGNANWLNSKLSSHNDSPVPYDYGHLFNLSLGHIFKLSASKNIRLSSSYHFRKGYFESNIDVEQSAENFQTIYAADANAYGTRLGNYHRMDLRISYINNKKWKSVISLDIQNVLNRNNEAYNYYDFLNEEKKLQSQLGLIPILSWRVVI